MSTASYTVTVLDYSPPSLTRFTAERCNSGGTAAQTDGTKIRVNITGAVSSVNSKNTISCKVYYKLSSSSTWTQSTTVSASNYVVSQSNLLLGQTFNALSSYDLKVSLTDYFSTVEQVMSVGTKQVMLDFYRDGTGIAFGKVAENTGKAEFDWPLKLSTPLAVSEGGTGGTTQATACAGIGALPLTGGTMTGSISSNGKSGKWIAGRDNAVVRTTQIPASSSFMPGLSMKSQTGAWVIGVYGHNLYLVYTTDANYEAGSNTASSFYFNTAGSYSGKAANVTGTVAVANGGTGATTVAGARNALGLGNTSDALPVANGGTGATTALAALANLGVEIRTGSVTVGTGGATVTFDTAFSTGHVPFVVGNGSKDATLSIHTVSETGFSIKSSSNYNEVRWIAMRFPT